MSIIPILLVLIYSIILVFLTWKWINWPIFISSQMIDSTNQIKISVIIPIRNEAKYILALLGDLNSQTIDFQCFEVIVIDDDSSDNSRFLVENFKSNYSLTLLKSVQQNNASPKKRAIELAIQHAQGELIVSTDGDCRVKPDWLKMIFNFQSQNNLQLVSGPVTFLKESTLFNWFQIVEFSSLVGVGAISMYLKSPNMCNGANLAYTKTAFKAVNGFEGNDNLASGDDEFLMHKIFAKYPNQVAFLKSNNAIVETNANKTLSDFVNQRKRWASKWANYQDWKISALAFLVFMLNLSTIYLAIYSFQNQLFLAIVLFKLIAEILFLGQVLSFLGKSKLILFIPIVQLFYPFYVLFVGLLAQKKGYTWKNRQLK